MMDSARLYLRLLGASLRGQMQYRASFLMLVFGHLFTTGAEFVGIWVLFERFGQLQGWTLSEAALLYGMVNVAFAVAEGLGRGFDVFDQQVRSGDFDRVLLRPRSTALQIAGQELQLRRLGRLLQGLAVLIWAGARVGLVWTPLRVLVVLGAVAGAAAMFLGVLVLQATLAFWSTETLEIANVVSYGGVETAQFPMSIYHPWFRRFFTYVVPLAVVTYLPGLVVLGRAGETGLGAAAGWLAPLAGTAFLMAALQVWQVGVRHYHSTGS